MKSDRWKKASLAINAAIRGLELDQVAFQYDPSASQELTSLALAAQMTGTESVEVHHASVLMLRELAVVDGSSLAAHP